MGYIKKGLVGAAASAVLVGSAVVGAGVAGADTNSFLDDVRGNGIAASDQTLVNWGTAVCNDIRRGIPLDTISNNIYMASQNSVSSGQASFLAESAAIYLC